MLEKYFESEFTLNQFQNGFEHRFGHRDQFNISAGVLLAPLRLAAGRAGMSRLSSNQENRSEGWWPKKRSAAVVPSERWMKSSAVGRRCLCRRLIEIGSGDQCLLDELRLWGR